MSFSIGIVGLPNAGKSTLFKALTKKEVLIASYPFATVDPNIGIIPVPDQRLEKIAQIADFKKITPTTIKFIDVAGLVKNAHKGEGLGNQFLSHIKECDGLLGVVRCFNNPNVPHIENKTDPQRDILIIENELIMKDLEVLENILKKLKEKGKGSQEKKILKKTDLLEKIKKRLLEGKNISDENLTSQEKNLIKEYQFLTIKPIIYVFNVENGQKRKLEFMDFKPSIFLDLKTESEITDLSKEEQKELNLSSNLDQLIVDCYNSLDLITFYTISGFNEARAWTLKNGKNILNAANKIHSDFKERFIKADVINWEKLIKEGKKWRQAKEKGLIQTVGKDYIIKNSDIIEIKI